MNGDKGESPRLTAARVNADMLRDSIKAREASASELTGEEKTRHADSIAGERSRLAELEAEITRLTPKAAGKSKTE